MSKWIREATTEEKATYARVSNLFDELSEACGEDAVDRAIETIGDYVFSIYPYERKANYNRVYKLAKRMGATVSELTTWYCID